MVGQEKEVWRVDCDVSGNPNGRQAVDLSIVVSQE
jgi:hypothetical protein